MRLVFIIIGPSDDQRRFTQFCKIITSTTPTWIVLPMFSYDILAIRYFGGKPGFNCCNDVIFAGTSRDSGCSFIHPDPNEAKQGILFPLEK